MLRRADLRNQIEGDRMGERLVCKVLAGQLGADAGLELSGAGQPAPLVA